MSETREIWISDGYGEGCRITRKADGRLLVMGCDDDLPENFFPLEPNTVLVFDGVRRRPTAEEDPSSAYDEWWDGQMREATADEILAVLGAASLTASQPQEAKP